LEYVVVANPFENPLMNRGEFVEADLLVSPSSHSLHQAICDPRFRLMLLCSRPAAFPTRIDMPVEQKAIE
jgi:hypothetical protein